MLQQVAEGTRPPFNEASAVLDNMALRRKVMQEMGRLGGLKGGKARAASLSKEKRKAIARKAALSRWKSP
ncbi:MAG TPA: hypothetical protein VN775_12590 [Opitutaceae bacterium]|nr:hypothetical protein [Opitutaceae bacterium]